MQLNKGFFALLMVSVMTVWLVGAPGASAFSFSQLWNTIVGEPEVKVAPVTTPAPSAPVVTSLGVTSTPTSFNNLPTFGDVPMIVASNPADGAIDARAPEFGWNQVEITFDRDTTEVFLNDFEITNTLMNPTVLKDAQGLSSGSMLAVKSLTSTSSNRLILNLNQPIPVLARTLILYRPTGQKICLGYLPGDVDENGVANANDAFLLLGELGKIDSLAEGRPHSFDIDRNGAFDGADASRLMGLLSGRDGNERWNGKVLPNECP